ncbi:hypothetical protein SAMN05444673_2252 [Bacillus sp. OV166]|uniref:YolD-like family protein n=1 Tax=Bacillus sp. OV166 TaxID=1882763 RepID=UPI000A2ADB50|nr:YolD-like family protein [Bacillus sp. OV166]SMQ72874.1 hypothetical protein SAMN05444673_2252 [Bacillus sp. OV166]
MNWQSASFIPIRNDQPNVQRSSRTYKPLLDEHQSEEFDLRKAYATEYNHAVNLTVWDEDILTTLQAVFITSIR